MATERLGRHFVGAALLDRRVRAGLSRPAFSARCADEGESVTPQHVARLEEGPHQPREALLVVMADVLGCDIDDLLVQDSAVQDSAVAS